MTSSVTVIGIGSPWGFDRMGWQVVDALRPMLETGDHTRRFHLLKLDRPGVGLLPHLAGSGEVVLIDALASELPSGRLQRLTPTDLAPNAIPSSHGLGVADALALLRALEGGDEDERLRLYGVEVGPLAGDPEAECDSAWMERCAREAARIIAAELISSR